MAFPDEAQEGTEAKPASNSEAGKSNEQDSNPDDFLGNSLEVAEEATKKRSQISREYREDTELKNMRDELDSLDIKLAAIKKQQELKLEQRKAKAGSAIPIATGHEDMVGKLQKQNAYLRERFGHDGNTGKY